MKISGFSFVRNGVSLYYPVVESIKSILPICDEYVVAVGEGSSGDTTRADIEAIGDPKIKIIDTKWDEKYFKRGVINAMQTDVAQQACKNDWLFYLQADEVVHEKYLSVIQKRCEDLLDNENVEGLLFHYKHFWGDYNHYHNTHGWYPNEIRIVRNLPTIHSWQSAQSFRHFYPYIEPRQETGTTKLSVARVDAEIFHYGWVRPPHLMQNKRRALSSVHWGRKKAEDFYADQPECFDYGPLDQLAVYRDSYPAVMTGKIKQMDWQDKLKPNPGARKKRKPHKHERLKYKLITWMEQNLVGGREIGGFKNYNLLKNV